MNNWMDYIKWCEKKGLNPSHYRSLKKYTEEVLCKKGK